RLHAGLGRAWHARGLDDQAARELRAALADIERPGGSLALPERRSAFHADKWDVYAQLAVVERSRALPAAAFEASERLRAREMLELLQRGRVACPTVAAVDLGVRRHDLARLVEFARGTLLPYRLVPPLRAAERGTGGEDSLWRAPLRQLHQYLVAPLEETGLLAHMTRLILVPHAEL